MRRTELGILVLLIGTAGGALPAVSQDAGVTLFTDVDRNGRSERFSFDESDVTRTRLGNRPVRSVEVSEGCRAMLFEGRDFRGRVVELQEDDNDLRNASLRTVGSVRVRCGRDEGWGEVRTRPGTRWNGSDADVPDRDARDRRDRDRREPELGVTLFRDRNLNGPSETFTGDVADLRNSRIGARKASSIRVPRGCVATLYTQPDFRGRSTEFHDDDNNLKNTEVGEDKASSIRVECGRPARDDRDPDHRH
jgi:hypothetical protein